MDSTVQRMVHLHTTAFSVRDLHTPYRELESKLNSPSSPEEPF